MATWGSYKKKPLRSKLKKTQVGSRAWQESQGKKTTTPEAYSWGKGQRYAAKFKSAKQLALQQRKPAAPAAKPSKVKGFASKIWGRIKAETQRRAGVSSRIQSQAAAGVMPSGRDIGTEMLQAGIAGGGMGLGGMGFSAAGKAGKALQPVGALGKKGGAAATAETLIREAGGKTPAFRTLGKVAKGDQGLKIKLGKIAKLKGREQQYKALNKIIKEEAKNMGKGEQAKVTKAAMGQLPKREWQTKLGGGASRVKTNTKTSKLTNKMLTSIVTAARKQPIIAGAVTLGVIMSVTGTIRDAIGTYPFAGFIKEESLQQLGWAYETARRNEDLEGMRDALDFRAEVLDTTTWEGIISKIPWANVQARNKEFYMAAEVNRIIQEREYEELLAGKESKFIRETKEAIGLQEKSTEKKQERYENYNDMDFKRKQKADEEMKDHWTNYLKQKGIQDKAAQDFWADYQANKQAYWEEYQKRREAERPSKLGFGLL